MDNVGTNRPRTLGLLIVVYLVVTFAISLISGFTKFDPPFYLYEFTQIFGFICVALLVFNRVGDLSKYNLDRYSLICILFFPGFLSSIPAEASIGLMALFFILPVVGSIGLFFRLRQDQVYREKSQRDFGKNLLLGFIIGAIFVFVVTKFWYSNLNVINILISQDPLILISNFTETMSTVAVIEESIFRGFLLGYLIHDRSWKPGYAILLQALLFWAPHIYQFDNPFLLRLLIPVFGLSLGWVAYKTKSILPGIFAHGIYNTIIHLL